ncbi:hypothetical protein HPO_07802 [Hyphomonas polymorpha PS728]|uniref:Uncharacterized protein n=1 Tax=Hyphomonas polymorpha PS728 TaxID=1280954 RepID=A0A062VKH1_9PROT|nr:hypothetical protein HPO_07802 [Hyphomonas polymorpha PS728]
MQHQSSISHPYTGMWVTADGHIRHELLPSGRYDEARGNRQSAYQGRYEITAIISTIGTIQASRRTAHSWTTTPSTTQAWFSTARNEGRSGSLTGPRIRPTPPG